MLPLRLFFFCHRGFDRKHHVLPSIFEPILLSAPALLIQWHRSFVSVSFSSFMCKISLWWFCSVHCRFSFILSFWRSHSLFHTHSPFLFQSLTLSALNTKTLLCNFKMKIVVRKKGSYVLQNTEAFQFDSSEYWAPEYAIYDGPNGNVQFYALKKIYLWVHIVDLSIDKKYDRTYSISNHSKRWGCFGVQCTFIHNALNALKQVKK